MAELFEKELPPEVVLMVKESARDLHYKLIESGFITKETPADNNLTRTYLVQQLTKATQTILKFKS